MLVLGSPRRRRRLAWLLGVAVAIGAVALLVSLVPSHSGSGRRVIPRAPAFGDVQTTGGAFKSSTAEIETARLSEKTVRPLAIAFVDDLARGRDLSQAYALLGPTLRGRYALLDWQQGRDLPFAPTGAEGGISIAFSGATTVGAVADLDQNRLVAVRFEKAAGRWGVDYIHAGHGSSYISSANYAPAGFVPGSRHETVWTWLALVGGLLGLIAIAVVIERRLS